MSALDDIAKAVDRIEKRLAAIDSGDTLVLTRKQACAQLGGISLRQLQRLIAAGRLVARPEGITREELARYVRTPSAPLPKHITKPKRERTAKDEADRGRDMLRAIGRQVRAQRAASK